MRKTALNRTNVYLTNATREPALLFAEALTQCHCFPQTPGTFYRSFSMRKIIMVDSTTTPSRTLCYPFHTLFRACCSAAAANISTISWRSVMVTSGCQISTSNSTRVASVSFQTACR